LFALFALTVIILSEIIVQLDLSMVHPGTKEIVKPFSLLSIKGLHMILNKMATNLPDFAPLGTVLVAMLGIGQAKATGFIGASLKKLVLSVPPHLMVMFVFLAALINLVIGSASAKWAIMAPVFLPIFMLLEYTPEFVQVVYRNGDSSTNIISPMMS
jgi:p-aminobenzoyl-glutamate transporter AbgT